MFNVFILCALISVDNVSLFDSRPLYINPLANPRSPELGLSIDTAKYLGERIYFLEGIIGKEVPIVTHKSGSLQLQLGLEASTWVMLGYKDGAFPLLTQDFYFSVPLYFRHGRFSGGLKFNHISAHKGDGLDGVVEESLSQREQDKIEELEDHTNADIAIVEPKTYSRDFLSFHFAYDYTIKRMKSRSYLQGGYIHKIFPSDLKRLFFSYGMETKYKMEDASPYYAHDITYNQDMDSLDWSGQLGVLFLSSEDKLFESRMAFTGYIGSDRRGQFLGRKIKQFGIGLFIR